MSAAIVIREQNPLKQEILRLKQAFRLKRRCLQACKKAETTVANRKRVSTESRLHHMVNMNR
ncbi:hypothetical protein EQO05_12670 [Methanosarcina sp. MSH10X1]|nr:hypothetical protein EQO05_12670 [Methanosarcina sp. MSH10X1]